MTWDRGAPLQIVVEVPGPGHRHVVTKEQLERFVELVPDWSEVSRGLRTLVLAEGSSDCDGWYQDGVIAVTAWTDPIPIAVSPEYHAAHRTIWERLGVPSRLEPRFIEAVPVVIDDDHIPREVSEVLDDYFGPWELELVSGAGDGEWCLVSRDEPVGTVMAELARIHDETHIYERRVLMGFYRVTAGAYQLLHVLLHELGHHRDAMMRPHPGHVVRGEDYAELWANRCADLVWDQTMAMLRR